MFKEDKVRIPITITSSILSIKICFLYKVNKYIDSLQKTSFLKGGF